MTLPLAIIAEDEPLLRAEIRHSLYELWPELNVCAEAEDGMQWTRGGASGERQGACGFHHGLRCLCAPGLRGGCARLHSKAHLHRPYEGDGHALAGALA